MFFSLNVRSEQRSSYACKKTIQFIEERGACQARNKMANVLGLAIKIEKVDAKREEWFKTLRDGIGFVDKWFAQRY
jgi:iron-sulfur cluster repair protein YtfE (RIC family)